MEFIVLLGLRRVFYDEGEDMSSIDEMFAALPGKIINSGDTAVIHKVYRCLMCSFYERTLVLDDEIYELNERSVCPMCGMKLSDVTPTMLTVAREFAACGFDIAKAESVIVENERILVAIIFGKSYDSSLFEGLPNSYHLRYIPFYVSNSGSQVLFDCEKSQYSGVFGLIGAKKVEKKVIKTLLDFIREKDCSATRAVLTLMGYS